MIENMVIHGKTSERRRILLKGPHRIIKLRFKDRQPMWWRIYDGRTLVSKGDTEVNFNDLTIKDRLVFETSDPVEYVLEFYPIGEVSL